jgi:hypothetical protein
MMFPAVLVLARRLAPDERLTSVRHIEEASLTRNPAGLYDCVPAGGLTRAAFQLRRDSYIMR